VEKHSRTRSANSACAACDNRHLSFELTHTKISDIKVVSADRMSAREESFVF
jgi:hypothetical protein